MILTGPEIAHRCRKGEIVINPFEQKRLNPNSYNLRLAPKLAVYLPVTCLDCKADNCLTYFDVFDEGYVLQPGKLYLGSTIEYTATDHFVPMLEGRSSLARLGVSVHQTGGFGDIGFKGTWTLEITCVEPVRIYPKIEVCQIQFWTCQGRKDLYQGKYSDQKGPTASKLYVEMERKQ